MSLGRWHPTQCLLKIGATSLENVGAATASEPKHKPRANTRTVIRGAPLRHSVDYCASPDAEPSGATIHKPQNASHPWENNQLKQLLGFLFASLLSSAGMTAATVAAVQSTNGSQVAWRGFVGSDQSATVGWSFQVGPQNLTVEALGVFDLNGAGLQTTHPVAL